MSKHRVIAFYLPQYHPIPENDEWWGKGFTDWVNVTKGKHRFFGHYQPHLPADLGFYDLRLEETRIAQAEMAKAHGITGFCYYHYWFNGKMLLERPFDEVLHSGRPDFPFCLCWANENWTRAWDGMDRDCLIVQDYDEYDPDQHIKWLEKAFSDKRYIRIDGKPLFLIYNASSIPDLSTKITKWRQVLQKKGYANLFLCSVKSVHNRLDDGDILNLGFDAIVDFFPNNNDKPRMKVLSFPKHYFCRIVNKIIKILGLDGRVGKLPVTYVLSYRSLVDMKIRRQISEHKTFPCVVPSWDNSPRRKIASYVVQNSNTDLYKLWFEKSIEKTSNFPSEEQIVFINAWNEWAEGCHLEPDLRNGRKFLEATLEVMKKSDRN